MFFSLLQGGDLPRTFLEDCQDPSLFLLQWVKTDHSLLMLFNNGTLQVNVVNAVTCQLLLLFPLLLSSPVHGSTLVSRS